MKKLLAVLLALTLSCSFMLSVSAQGDGSASAGNSFEESVKAENWKMTTDASWAYVKSATEKNVAEPILLWQIPHGNGCMQSFRLRKIQTTL